jgi:hypothetical protein
MSSTSPRSSHCQPVKAQQWEEVSDPDLSKAGAIRHSRVYLLICSEKALLACRRV